MELDLKKHLPTIAGLSAITLWSFLPVLSIYSNNVPPFLKLGLALIFSSIAYMAYWSVKYKGDVIHKLFLPKVYILFCVIGLFGNNFTFLKALNGDNKIDAYITMNAWPICTLFFTALIWNEKLKKMDYLGSILGLCGVLLIGIKGEEENLATSLDNNSMLIATANCLIWSLFSSLNRKFSNIPADSVGVPLFIIALLSLALHFIFEPKIYLSVNEWITIALLGLGPWGAAYTLWGFALHKSTNVKALVNYGFLGPALGMIWMVAMGYAHFTMEILVAFLCVVMGSLLGSLQSSSTKG